MKHEILISSELEAPFPHAELLRRCVTAALEAEGVALPCEVDILVTDNDGIHAINRETRGVDRPTDVLSFPAFELTPGAAPTEADAQNCDPATGLFPLGDMVISLEQAERQAADFRHSLRRELGYLTVHSVLHLLGYDHLDEGEQKARMRAREEAIMEGLGIPQEDGPCG